MARSLLRIIAQTNRSSDAYVAASVTIRLYDKGTVTHSNGVVTSLGTPFSGAVYAAETGGSPLGSEFTADANGRKDIWLENPNAVDVVISGTGITTYVYDKHRSEIDPIEALTTSRTGVYPARSYNLGASGVADRTAIAAAITACAAGGGGDVALPPGTFEITGNLTLSSGVRIRGAGPGATRLRLNSSAATNTITAAGALGSAVLLATSGNEGAITVTCSSGGVAMLGLAVGDLVYINEGTGTAWSQYNRVRSIAGEVVTLTMPLYETYQTANAAAIRKVTPVEDIGIFDLTLDGSLASGAEAFAISLFHTLRARVENVYVDGYQDGAIYLSGGYGLRVAGVHIEDCGSGGYSDLWIAGHTAFEVDGVLSERSSGFGPQISNAQGGRIANLASVGATSRAIKIDHAAHNVFTNIRAEGGGSNGFCLTGFSHHNRVVNLEAIRNTGTGIWIEGQSGAPGSHHNDILNAYSAFNTNSGYEIDVAATDNVLQGRLDFAGSFDNGARNLILPPTFGQEATAVGVNDDTSTSTSYSDVDDLAVTLTTTGGKLVVSAEMDVYSSNVGGGATLAFSLDGGAEVAARTISCAVINQAEKLTATHTFTGLAAGSHTVKARWKIVTGGTTATCPAGRRSLSVREGARA